MEAGPPSPLTRAKESLDEYVRPQWEDEYTDVTLRTDPRYALYYTAASMSPLEAYHFYRKIQCEAEQKLVFFEIEAIIKDPNARTAWLLLNTDFGMADMLAGLGIIPCRDRTSEQRPALEIFPAPSPPPPLDDWVRSRDPQAPPPFAISPTARAPLAGRAAVAALRRVRGHRLLVVDGDERGLLPLCCLCCALCGYGYDRDRATSRMVGYGPERVDGIGWKNGPGRSVGGGNPGLFGPDYRTKAHGGSTTRVALVGGGGAEALRAQRLSSLRSAPQRRRPPAPY